MKIIMWHQLLLQQKIKVPSGVDQGTASGINAMEVKLKPHLQLLQTRNRVNQDQPGRNQSPAFRN